MINALTKSADDTQRLAAAVADTVQEGDLVLLVGEMGAGKTTFTQGFGRALGVDEAITSPTFVLMRTYDAPLPLHHVDIYRLDHLQEVIDIGLLELLDEGGVALVEWGDLATPVLPRDFLEVRLDGDIADEGIRRITLRCAGEGWSARESSLTKHVGQWLTVDTEEDA